MMVTLKGCLGLCVHMHRCQVLQVAAALLFKAVDGYASQRQITFDLSLNLLFLMQCVSNGGSSAVACAFSHVEGRLLDTYAANNVTAPATSLACGTSRMRRGQAACISSSMWLPWPLPDTGYICHLLLPQRHTATGLGCLQLCGLQLAGVA